MMAALRAIKHGQDFMWKSIGKRDQRKMTMSLTLTISIKFFSKEIAYQFYSVSKSGERVSTQTEGARQELTLRCFAVSGDYVAPSVNQTELVELI
jgi:hypothetical protein